MLIYDFAGWMRIARRGEQPLIEKHHPGGTLRFRIIPKGSTQKGSKMADNYYYMWEFITSVTIVVLVAAYIIHDRIRLRYDQLNETERRRKTLRLNGMTQTLLGAYAAVTGVGWIIYMQTHRIFVSPELEGFHNLVPAILMGGIGFVVLVFGLRKYWHGEDASQSGPRAG